VSVEELYGRLWRALAAKEGHRPLHLIGCPSLSQAEAGSRKQPRGETGNRVIEMATQGMTLTQISDALGLAKVTVHKHAQRRGIVLRRAAS
jgi:DNA-binding NarL/FixJ family response regulator